ncbi:MAG TPA: diadenylate cyclase CdaA [Thermoanaerobaculia bacterium]|nr:diadenylate cyclase CdaA [Thermoanaerobaculia bacterium]
MNLFFERLTTIDFGWRDAVDIVVVALILYNILVLIRGTRAMQMSMGLLALIGANFIASALDLLALEALSREILFYLPFAIIVLFQHEIRRALASFGRNPLVAFLSERSGALDVEAIVKAANDLASERVGALLAIERTQALRMYTDSGKKLDALVSYELLVTLFTHNAPLHDGAVVLQGDRIVAAAVFLPLSGNVDISKQYGTRHRAALGLSEETDAFVIVASEERGTIGVALDGVLYENLDPQTLGEMLRIHVSPRGKTA